ncbi:hypothetical protein ACO0K9_17170 [Undibacterium sp. Ji50W]|uniref:hypothetical protein n=1 Tax=Undibacterium sp. Ji50W TaxID=3413041 RepID=UPI003BF2F7AF
MQAAGTIAVTVNWSPAEILAELIKCVMLFFSWIQEIAKGSAKQTVEVKLEVQLKGEAKETYKVYSSAPDSAGSRDSVTDIDICTAGKSLPVVAVCASDV